MLGKKTLSQGLRQVNPNTYYYWFLQCFVGRPGIEPSTGKSELYAFTMGFVPPPKEVFLAKLSVWQVILTTEDPTGRPCQPCQYGCPRNSSALFRKGEAWEQGPLPWRRAPVPAKGDSAGASRTWASCEEQALRPLSSPRRGRDGAVRVMVRRAPWGRQGLWEKLNVQIDKFLSDETSTV